MRKTGRRRTRRGKTRRTRYSRGGKIKRKRSRQGKTRRKMGGGPTCDIILRPFVKEIFRSGEAMSIAELFGFIPEWDGAKANFKRNPYDINYSPNESYDVLVGFFDEYLNYLLPMILNRAYGKLGTHTRKLWIYSECVEKNETQLYEILNDIIAERMEKEAAEHDRESRSGRDDDIAIS